MHHHQVRMSNPYNTSLREANQDRFLTHTQSCSANQQYIANGSAMLKGSLKEQHNKTWKHQNLFKSTFLLQHEFSCSPYSKPRRSYDI